MILPTGNKFLNKRGFTFFEVMVTIVILAVGMSGIYRAFLLSLNYQQYIIKRLHVMNILSDEFARAEDAIISEKGQVTSFSNSFLTNDGQSAFSIERYQEPLKEQLKGLVSLKITLNMPSNDKTLTFTRSSLVYDDK